MSDKKDLNKNINFLYEIGSLKNIPRIWQQVLGQKTANNIEHSFRVVLLALMISRMEKKGDEEKIMKMALFHDLCEARSVDTAFFHKNYVDRKEEESQKDQLLGTVFGKDILDLLKEYRKRESLESKIVKDADNLECDLELKELEKRGSETAKKFLKFNRPDVAKKLFTESAKKMWQDIIDSNTDEWHLGRTSNWINSDNFNK